MDNGCIFLDKPAGMTSQQAVSNVKRFLGLKKAGHTGTLDPMATGLLVVLFGRSTKLASRFSGLDKEYIAAMELGKTSDTYDSSGTITASGSINGLGQDKIKHVTAGFVGPISQVPPMYSAKKVQGKRLYQYARKNISLIRRPNNVFIRELEIISVNIPHVQLRVVCSSGTYIRSLIHDIGQALGCGAIMTGLRRTRIGSVNISRAVSMSQIEKGGCPVLEHGRISEFLPSE